MKRYAGYFTVDRDIFDHPALQRPDRLWAWQRLIAMAAWKPEGRRGVWGVVHLERGELATSVRILAKEWQWPPGRVQRFLNRLRRLQMITVTTTRSPTRSKTDSATDTAPGTFLEREISIITVCNYDKFQNASTGRRGKSIQQPIQQPIQRSAETPMLPGFAEALTTEPSNQKTTVEGTVGEVRGAPTAPTKHGARSRHGNIFIHRGSQEWLVYVEDFRSVRGVDPMPKDGGFWFYANGEAARPANQRYWRNVRFGAAK